MKIAEHNILMLDYWRDEVSYQGITLPSGSIGCAALNISNDVIEIIDTKFLYLPCPSFEHQFMEVNPQKITSNSLRNVVENAAGNC